MIIPRHPLVAGLFCLGNRGVAMNVLNQIRPLVDLIIKAESRANYDAFWGGIQQADYPPKQLTQLTVGDVLDWQDSIDRKYRSEAAGAWQILEDTLRGVYRAAGVPLSAKFDEATQDRLGLELMRRRGLDDFLAGRLSLQRFATSLAKEWASLPVLHPMRGASRQLQRGQSYYAGDGLNKAIVKPQDLEQVLLEIQQAKADPAPEPRHSVTQSKTVQGSAVQMAAACGTAATAVGALDGTAQIIVAVFAGLAFLTALWVLRDRLAKWAEGRR